jgi:hypothetical protein
MNPAIVSLIIEARQAEYESIYAVLLSHAEAWKESETDPDRSKEEKEQAKDICNLIFGLMDEMSNRHERDIEEVKHRYSEQCSDISTNYLTDLPGWTRSA